MIFSALLVLVPLTGDQAIARAKQALKEFDVKGPFRLQRLGGAYGATDKSQWHVTLLAGSETFQIAMSGGGRINVVERPNSGQLSPEPNDPTIAKQAAIWLAKMRPVWPTRVVRPDDRGGSSVYYEGLVRGYPVVYPRGAVGYSFNVRGGKLLSYYASEEAPKIRFATPKLTEAQALAAVDAIFKRDVIPEGQKRGWEMSYQLKDSRQLGWAVPDRGGAAKLVWWVPFQQFRKTSAAVQGGGNGMLIDAVTGAKISTRAVP